MFQLPNGFSCLNFMFPILSRGTEMKFFRVIIGIQVPDMGSSMTADYPVSFLENNKKGGRTCR